MTTPSAGAAAAPGLRLLVDDDVDNVPADAWDRLSATGTLFSSHDWLRMRQEDLPDDGQARYVRVVSADGAVRAAAAGYAFDRPPHPLYTPGDVFGPALDEHFTELLDTAPSVIGAGWSEFRGEILVDPDPAAGDPDVATGRAAQAMAEWADGLSCPALALYYLPLGTALSVARNFGPERATVVFHDVEAVIENEWDTFNAFLGHVSKSRRKGIRRELKGFRDSGRRIRELSLAEAVDLIAPLNSALMLKYGHAYTTARARQVFERQAKYLDHRSSVLLAEDDDGPVGFFLRYRHGGGVYSRVAGFDYGRPRRFDYFALSYEEIEDAVRRGDEQIHLGLGTLDLKLSRGARPRPLYSVLVSLRGAEAGMSDAARRLSVDRLRRLADRHGTQGPGGILVEAWCPDF